MWKSPFIKQAPGGIIWSVVAALLINGGAAMIGFRASIPVYLYIPLFLVSTAALLVIASQILQYGDRYRQGKKGIAEERLEKTILEWLANGYSVRKSDIPGDDAVFTWLARDAVGRELGVTRLKSDPDRISIFEVYTLSNEQLESMHRLPPEVYQEVAEDMRIDIAAFDIDIGTMALGPQSGGAKDSTLWHNAIFLRHRVIFGNQFGMEEFYEGISFVYRSATVVSAYLQRILRLADQHSTSPITPDTPDA